MSLLKFYFSPSGRAARWEWWVKLVVVTTVILALAASVEMNWKVKSSSEATTTVTSTETSGTGASETTTERDERVLWKIDLRSDGTALPVALLLVLYPAIIVTIKRYHDRNKSGWWVLIALVPLVGPVWQVIELGFLPGTPGANRFGPSPSAKAAVAPA